jgi:hypothetical protein
MLDWLDQFASDVGDAASATLLAAIIWVFSLLVTVANFLFAIDAALFNFTEGVFTNIGKLFHSLWNLFFQGLILNIFKALRALHKWLEDHLKPIIAWLLKARAWLQRIFQQYLKPFLNMIQRMRQFLLVLRLLGVKWAAALDAKLAQLEGRIAGIFLTVQGVLNGAIDILNCLADPLNLFRRPTAVLSIRRIIPSLVRVTTGYPIGFFMPSPRSNAPAGIGQLPLNFDSSDPSMNPPASSYFTGDDGLGAFSGFTDGAIPDDGAVDDLTILDYFNDGLYPPPNCSDPVSCLAAYQQAAFASVGQKQ